MARKAENHRFHDSFMLVPANFDCGDILAMDRAYIDYEKMEAFNHRGVTYVIKMKMNLNYEVLGEHALLDDGKYRNRNVKSVLFRKGNATHEARIVTYTETIDMMEFFEHPERDWIMMLEDAATQPP